jgi:hypothetical protein
MVAFAASWRGSTKGVDAMTGRKKVGRGTTRPKARAPKPSPPVPMEPPAEDLTGAASALVDADAGKGRRPDEGTDASVQDALKDWPELETERDEWTLDRPGKGVERAGD